MSIQTRDFCQLIIQPTLHYLNMYSLAAEKLLIGTAAQHSSLNPMLVASGFGVYQITGDQHRRVWDHYLAFRPDLASKVRGLASQHCFLEAPDRELISNLAYGTAIAWALFLMSELPLPHEEDEQGLIRCWREVYGSEFGSVDNHEPFTKSIRHCMAA